MNTEIELDDSEDKLQERDLLTVQVISWFDADPEYSKESWGWYATLNDSYTDDPSVWENVGPFDTREEAEEEAQHQLSDYLTSLIEHWEKEAQAEADKIQRQFYNTRQGVADEMVLRCAERRVNIERYRNSIDSLLEYIRSIPEGTRQEFYRWANKVAERYTEMFPR